MMFNNIFEEYGTFDPYVLMRDKHLTSPVLIKICYYFMLSKIWEFMDTFLIMFRGQDTIFLQKYHHIGALWCFYLSYYYNVSFIIYLTFFNSFVHTIMYSYYLASTLGIRFKTIKPFITLLQICQLSSGPIPTINVYIYQYYNTAEGLVAIISVMYIIILIALFINFSINTYVKNKTK